MAKYEKFKEWMVGKKVEDEDGDRGVVTRSCEDGTDTVWVLWETPDSIKGMELWCTVSELTFLETQECEPESVPIPWKVGQIVWDILYGKGVVSSVSPGTCPVEVKFDAGSSAYYTLQGGWHGIDTRTLFFSEPKIIAETIPPKKPFTPKLKEGDTVAVFHVLSGSCDVVTVLREEEDNLYFKYASGQKDYYSKQHIRVKTLGEEIVFD